MGTFQNRTAAITAWLPAFRRALGDVVEELGGTRRAKDVCGVSHTYIADLIRGDATPSAAMLRKLTAAWPDRLPTLPEGSEGALASYARKRRVVPDTPAVPPIPIEGSPDGASACVDTLMRDRGAAYALCVSGDWLKPHISRGDVVWVQIGSMAEDGDAVVCRPASGENVYEIRAVRAHKSGATLETLGRETPAARYSDMKVIGRVVGHLRAGNPGIQIPKPPIITA
jgi:SOS-response transcriptional repressor LexA